MEKIVLHVNLILESVLDMVFVKIMGKIPMV